MNRLSKYLIITFFLFISYCCGEKPQTVPPCINCPINLTEIDSDPVWSPDGQYIAYFHSSSNLNQIGIYLIRPNGTDNRIWFKNLYVTPQWSNDNRWIVYSKGGQILISDLYGNDTLVLTEKLSYYFPCWNKDNDLVAYNKMVCDSIPCGIWIFDLKTAINELLVPYGIYPFFNPINDEILYKKRWIENNGNVIGDSIFTINYSSKKIRFIRTLTNPNFDNRYFKINSTGDKILFISKSTYKSSLPELWIMDSDGKNLMMVSSPITSAAWSPDGQKIVYTDASSNDGRLWIININDNYKIPLTNDF